MAQAVERRDPADLAGEIRDRIENLPTKNTPNARAVRREYSAKVKSVSPGYVIDLARHLIESYSMRWVAYELIASHKGAFASLGRAELEELGQGIDSWWTVDAFARTLSGPAWRDGQIPEQVIYEWALSPDRWWRRAALVSTVALNMRSKGGHGDVKKTLTICRILAADHDDMVVKANSWALRELVPHDPEAVHQFLDLYGPLLAGRVKREVSNKLNTGLKHPYNPKLA